MSFSQCVWEKFSGVWYFFDIFKLVWDDEPNDCDIFPGVAARPGICFFPIEAAYSNWWIANIDDIYL
jgi:hypothetical protein